MIWNYQQSGESFFRIVNELFSSAEFVINMPGLIPTNNKTVNCLSKDFFTWVLFIWLPSDSSVFLYTWNVKVTWREKEKKYKDHHFWFTFVKQVKHFLCIFYFILLTQYSPSIWQWQYSTLPIIGYLCIFSKFCFVISFSNKTDENMSESSYVIPKDIIGDWFSPEMWLITFYLSSSWLQTIVRLSWVNYRQN